jgi:tRNA G26 N,N-dimethylase Trm1
VTLGTTKRIQSLLTGIIDERPLQNIPLSFDIAFICSSIKSYVPDKRDFVYAMKKLGYNVI